MKPSWWKYWWMECIAAEGEALALGDAALLRRVLDNLAYNAIEHTPPGGSIEIRVEKRGEKVRAQVSDGGPGVPPEARVDIFKKFFQNDLRSKCQSRVK